MHVGVTGSSGFIGTALVEALEERGDRVTRFIRPGGAHTHDVVRWDPRRGLVDENDLRDVGGFDALVHLAGAGIADQRWSASRKEEILTSRTKSTSLLVEAITAGEHSPRVVASGSAIGYYGSRGDETLDETSSSGTGFLAHTCIEWENAAYPLRDHGTSVALLRTGIVLDRTGGSLKRQLPLFRFGVGGILANGAQWLSPISLRDEVRAILWIIDRAHDGPVNLVCPNPLTNRDFTTALARELHRPAVARVPKVALQLVLGAELTHEAVLASQRVVPSVLMENGFIFDHAYPSGIIKTALAH